MKIKALHLNANLRLGAYGSRLWQTGTANQGIESIEHTEVSGGGFLVTTHDHERGRRVVFVSTASVEYAEYDVSEPVAVVAVAGPSAPKQRVALPPVGRRDLA